MHPQTLANISPPLVPPTPHHPALAYINCRADYAAGRHDSQITHGLTAVIIHDLKPKVMLDHDDKHFHSPPPFPHLGRRQAKIGPTHQLALSMITSSSTRPPCVARKNFLVEALPADLPMPLSLI